MLDQAHRIRNLAEYEGSIEIADELLEALIRIVELMAAQLSGTNDDK